MVSEMTKTGKGLGGIIDVGAVDGNKNKELAEKFNIQNYPTILFFGNDKTKPV